MQALLGSLTGLVLLLTPVAHAGQAVTHQQNAAHSGAAVEPSLRPPLSRVWTRSFPGPLSYPVIADGRVFVVDLSGRGPIGDRTRVIALSARSGRVLWRHELNASGGGALAYEDGRLFVSLEFSNDERSLEALDARSGRELWSLSLRTGGTPPVPFDGTVYLGIGSLVLAVRAEDGQIIWSTIAEPRGGGVGTPALAGERVFAVYGCDNAYALNRHTGEVVWRNEKSCAGGSRETAVFYRGMVFSDEISDGFVYDADTGQAVRPLPASIRTPAAYAAGRSVALEDTHPPARAGPGQTLVARSARSGRVLWRFRGDGYLDGGPVIVGRTVYLGSGSGRMYGLVLRTGRVVWRDRIGLPVPHPRHGFARAVPAAGEGLLVVPALRRLVAYR